MRTLIPRVLFLALLCSAASPWPASASEAPAAADPPEAGAAAEAAAPDDSGQPFPGVTRELLEAAGRTGSTGSGEVDAGTIDGALLDPAVVRELIARVQPAIVKVTHESRDGHALGTGSGFFISADGLVATNHHVIGAARPIKIETLDGAIREVAAIHAWDRHLDLAILRVHPAPGESFPFLDLAGADDIVQGQPILGFGNPRGLKFSVVSGLVSALRRLDADLSVEGETPDFPMIQVAMPIEMGNSGGPVVDLGGRVLGIVTIKHVSTPNLGFAVPASHLVPLLDQPNTVPMSRWLTFGALDPALWTPLMGSRWSQRGGVISAEGPGDGFGGRTLCLSERSPSGQPYEVAVRVKLADESGAAGLAFASDGGDRHYGFYPTAGRLRLTRFEGPDVSSWTILEQIETPAYLPGEWNELKVRVTDTHITCHVNGIQVLELEESVLRGGRAGLCKFRDPAAEFRHFQAAAALGGPEADPAVLTAMAEAVEAFAADRLAPGELLDALAPSAAPGRALLEERAAGLEARAAELRRLSEDLHLRETAQSLSAELASGEMDLFRAGLHIARLDDPEVDPAYYLEQFDRLAADAREVVEASPSSDREKALRLASFLFDESGFHGSRSEYYHPGNSYLNEVLEYREGLPITLGVVFIELARRLEIAGVEGIPLPGHFLVGHRDRKEDPALLLMDVFEGGKAITRKEAEDISWSITRNFPSDSDFAGAAPRDIVVRMLRNLVGIEMNQRRPAGARQYIELILAVSPEEYQERFQRALLRYQDDDVPGAKEDFDWLLQRRPPGLDYERLEMFREQLDSPERPRR